MNIKSGFKTLAVVLPMTLAPLKSGAQNITKQTEKTVSQEVMKIKPSLGAGYSVEPFFYNTIAEPKLTANVGLSTYNMHSAFKANVGKSMQTIDTRIAFPVKFKNTDLSMDAGGYLKYSHISQDKNMVHFVPEDALNKSDIAVSNGYSSIGFYVEPKYTVSDRLGLSAKVEVGNYTLMKKGSVQKEVVEADKIKTNISETGIVGNIGAGAQYNINNKISVGGDINYSTLHKKAGGNLQALIKL